jgi:protein-tyrosine phosphatase
VLFSIMFVCTGNICRSPVAERLLTARLSGAVDLTVSSAGSRALVGHPIDEPSALALRERGVDPRGHRARRLHPELIHGADLILTASAEHRTAVLVQAPLAMNRTFTLREFTRLAAGLPPSGPSSLVPDAEHFKARVAAVAGQRGLVPVAARGQDDIDDPYGRSVSVARATVDITSDAIGRLIAALDLVPGVG